MTSGGATTRTATRRTSLAIWYVFVAGALGLTVVAAIFDPGAWSRVRDDDRGVIAWVAFAMAPVCVLASMVVPRRIKPPGATVENIAVARTIVTTALNGSVALFAPLAWMVSGNAIALVALGISFVGLLLVMPSQRRWAKLSHAIGVTLGQDPAAADDASRPLPPLSRRAAVVGLGLFGLGSLGLLVLFGLIFWTVGVRGRLFAPFLRALVLLGLALAMTGSGVLRLAGTFATRRPRQQRAYGVLLLIFACYLLVEFVRML